TFSPEIDTPTGQAADVEVVADYEDLDALRAFARQVDVVTFEFENVPIDAVDAIEAITPVRPCGMALHTAQQRAREKQFLADRGFPTAAFGRAASLDELWDAVARVGDYARHSSRAAIRRSVVRRILRRHRWRAARQRDRAAAAQFRAPHV